MSDVWIRSKEVVELLSSIYGDDQVRMAGRLRAALGTGGIRCQARYATIHRADDQEKRHNWAIPDWVWQVPSGRLRLIDDHFAPGFTHCERPEEQRGELIGVERLDLQVLKFHGPELRNFFQLPEPKPEKSRPIESKASAISECRHWLEQQFGEDVEFRKRKGDFENEALEHFAGRLSGRGFERAWSEAVTLHPKRAKAGRPRSG